MYIKSLTFIGGDLLSFRYFCVWFIGDLSFLFWGVYVYMYVRICGVCSFIIQTMLFFISKNKSINVTIQIVGNLEVKILELWFSSAYMGKELEPVRHL